MNVYIVSKGYYEDEHIVDVVPQEELDRYLQSKTVELINSIRSYIGGVDPKKLAKVDKMEFKKEDGSYCVSQSYFIAEEEGLHKMTYSEFLFYELREIWKPQ